MYKNEGVRYSGKCPICNDNITVTDGISFHTEPDSTVASAYRCTGCDRIFLIKNKNNTVKGYPFSPRYKEFSQDILRISNSFTNIYNQAEYAQSLSLDKIAGPAYRKALEFLVKDYAKMINPEKEKETNKIRLGKVINDLIESPRIKEIAKRAAWLGNDEVHYLRKWTEKDINDLKTLIQLLVYYIDAEELSKKAIVDMPEVGK